MNELLIKGKTYISSKRAAEITGYAKDYVGQLCREGYVEATMVGRSWYVLESSIRAHRFGAESAVEAKSPKDTDTTAPETQSWTPAYYTPEPLPMIIPSAAPKASISLPSEPVPYVAPAPVSPPAAILPHPTVESPSETIAHMQDAWQEWFSANRELQIESPEVIESRYEHNEEPEVVRPSEPVREPINILSDDFTKAIPTPIEAPIAEPIVSTYQPVYEPAPFVEAEPIAIHKVVREPVPVMLRQNQRVFVNPGFVPATPRTAASSGYAGIYRALLLSIATLAIAVAIIGSGLADSYLNTSVGGESSIVNFIEGKRVVK